MNIIEAVKSGKPFKRRNYGDDMWCHVTLGTDQCQEIRFKDHKPFLPYESDILATDWEVKEDTVTITKTQLRDALEQSIRKPHQEWVDVIWKRLGFE